MIALCPGNFLVDSRYIPLTHSLSFLCNLLNMNNETVVELFPGFGVWVNRIKLTDLQKLVVLFFW